MKAVILAGGKGTRMRPLTNKMPKVMLPIRGKPIVEHQVDLLKKYGINDIVMCTGYLGEQIKKHFEDGSKFGVKITYSGEKDPLGTGGAIKNAEKFIDKTFLLLYGDIMLNMNLEKLLGFHKEQGAKITLVIHETDHPYDSDLITVDESGLVTKIFHKPNHEPFPSTLSKTSVCIVEPDVLKQMPEGKHDFEKEIIPKFIEQCSVFGYITDELVRDIGTIERMKSLEERAREF
ncbi:MAG: nucleotidyltransferase family protein [Candidatus Aenigmarchaeota archaeon]|nr:nucleotidyltransferase family protein [Candidatus Aenigmarchaeota archaeon]